MNTCKMDFTACKIIFLLSKMLLMTSQLFLSVSTDGTAGVETGKRVTEYSQGGGLPLPLPDLGS